MTTPIEFKKKLDRDPLKILVIGRWYTAMFDDLTAIRDGTEILIKSSLKYMLQRGHEIHVVCVGEVIDAWKSYHPNLHVHSVSELTLDSFTNELHHADGPEEMKEIKLRRRAYAKRVSEAAYSMIKTLNPDVVFNHLSSRSIANHCEEVPIATMMHLCTTAGDFMQCVAQYKRDAKIKASGGVVYGSQRFLDLSLDSMKKMQPRHPDVAAMKRIVDSGLYMTDVENGLYRPLDRELETFKPLESNGEILLIGRLDKTDQKNFGFVSKLGHPVTIICTVTTGMEKQIKTLEAMPNVTLVMNAPRKEVLDRMRKSAGVIMACPEESAGIAAMEAMNQGALPILFHREDDYHAIETFVPEGVEYPNRICITDPEAGARLGEAIDFCKSVTQETRLKNIELCREKFSIENWVYEMERVLYKAHDEWHHIHDKNILTSFF